MTEEELNDADAMRRAFESFMMTGKNASGEETTSDSPIHGSTKKKKKKKKNSGRPTSNESPSQQKNLELIDERNRDNYEEKMNDESKTQWEEQQIRKWEKKSWSICHKFAKELKENWLEIDAQTELVVNSLSGIRSRLPMHAKLIDRFNREIGSNDLTSNSGYRDTIVRNYEETTCQNDLNRNDYIEILNKSDLELAMSHDLIQHEKMMEGLRSLLSTLSESVDTLSRHLDEMLQHQLESNDFPVYVSSRPSFLKVSHLPEALTDLFHMLSLETYRKQCLSQKIFESALDGVMEQVDQVEQQKNELNFDWLNLGPQGIINRCCSVWSHSSHHSEINLVVLNGVLETIRIS